MRVRLIGYWCDNADDMLDDENVGWPDPRDLVDTTWSSGERELVAAYLEQGFRVWVYCGLSRCRLCGEINGAAELMDDAYIWPEGLAHYVREHSVKPPEEVLVHISRHLEGAGRDWAAEYADRAFSPEGVTLFHESDAEVETLEVDRAWWRKVTSA